MRRRLTKDARRDALVHATIGEIAVHGSLDVTVAQVARRAGMSSALAHHHFGSKEAILLLAMRHILSTFAQEVQEQRRQAHGHDAQLDAVLRACFAPSNYQPETVAAWLTFYAHARTSPAASGLLRVYRRRLRTNLAQALRPLVGDAAGTEAQTLGALIDGLYLHQATGHGTLDAAGALEIVRTYADRLAAHHRGGGHASRGE